MFSGPPPVYIKVPLRKPARGGVLLYVGIENIKSFYM
jgi:hypothetical protein